MIKHSYALLLVLLFSPLAVSAEGMAEIGIKAAISGNSEMADLALEDAFYYGSVNGAVADQTLGSRKVTPSYGLNPYFDFKFISDSPVGAFIGFGADIGSQESKSTAYSAPLTPGYFSYSEQTYSIEETNFSLYFGPSFTIDKKFYILPSVGYRYHEIQGTNSVLDYWYNSIAGVGATQINDNTMKGKAKGTTLGLDFRYKISRLYEVYGGYTYNYSVSGFMNWDELTGPSGSSSSSGGSGGSSSLNPHNGLGVYNYQIGGMTIPFLTIPVLPSSGYILKGGTYTYGIRYNMTRGSYIRIGIESERTLVTYDGYMRHQFGLGGPFITLLDDDLLTDYLIYNKQRRRFSDSIVFAIGAIF
ncbi:hypothetical protein [Leptonema illini]|uniref:Outer membrane protein beta-barrel domain-containing protein n=1 Tax=Leptonema illini DSM 21528 TaxID=929563 RepID=H2CFU4_9LEPT|nr:hypothetical protein [Leptonema illini]EHQ06793.1 hypothetical protein Lepil_2115 [Leptonema illini DSM 21528]